MSDSTPKSWVLAPNRIDTVDVPTRAEAEEICGWASAIFPVYDPQTQTTNWKCFESLKRARKWWAERLEAKLSAARLEKEWDPEEWDAFVNEAQYEANEEWYEAVKGRRG